MKTVNGIKVLSSIQPQKRLEFNEWAKKYRVSQAYQAPYYSQAQWMINQNSVKGTTEQYTGLSWLDKILF
jgi:hypothetical protein